MRLCLSGLEQTIELSRRFVTTMEVHNRVLFSRICHSLQSGNGLTAIEPYSIWEGDIEQKPEAQMLFIASPLLLPWADRDLANGISKRVEELLFEDEGVRLGIEGLFSSINSSIARMALQLHSDYGFTIGWELKRYLKLMGFGVEEAPDDSLFDKVIKFLEFSEDARLSRVLVFVNLKLFFSKKEVEQIIDQAVFSGLSMLLLEGVQDNASYENEKKYVVDQDFLEFCQHNSQQCPSLCSGDFVPSVLEQ